MFKKIVIQLNATDIHVTQKSANELNIYIPVKPMQELTIPIEDSGIIPTLMLWLRKVYKVQLTDITCMNIYTAENDLLHALNINGKLHVSKQSSNAVPIVYMQTVITSTEEFIRVTENWIKGVEVYA